MKRIIYTIITVGVLGLSSCSDWFLELDPLDTTTDAVYFKKASEFKEYANSFYGQLLGWNSTYGTVYSHMDDGTDLSTYSAYSGNILHGNIQIPSSDSRWDNCFANIRVVNILLDRASKYPGIRSEIEQYISEAYFFRAYNYFYLLKFFGGVPVVTTVLDVDSPELMGPRNSRYEVVNLILDDLDKAIGNLPKEANIPSDEKGRIGVYGAKAFKARVLLFEATWRKYNGTSTDYSSSKGPEADQVNEFLAEAVALCEDVMANGGFAIWNYNSNSSMQKMSSRYLFCLEDADSNPAGLTKSTNKEFIISSLYDKETKPGAMNINQTIPKMTASRKLMDLFLCTDGLPISMSSRFKGYASPADEFQNRDLRMKSYITENNEETTLTTGTSGYVPAKFYAQNRANLEESADYPVLRLAEVFLIYAEALFERNGSITDEQLGRSINVLRNRAGVKALTNAFIVDNGLDMLYEIRRERAVELYMEGYRFDDLRRWGIAEQELNESRLGMVVGGANYPTTFVGANGVATDKYRKNTFVWGEESIETPVGMVNCVVIDSKSNYAFTKTHYLWPIPQQQINLNPNLIQNPGYAK